MNLWAPRGPRNLVLMVIIKDLISWMNLGDNDFWPYNLLWYIFNLINMRLARTIIAHLIHFIYRPKVISHIFLGIDPFEVFNFEQIKFI